MFYLSLRITVFCIFKRQTNTVSLGCVCVCVCVLEGGGGEGGNHITVRQSVIWIILCYVNTNILILAQFSFFDYYFKHKQCKISGIEVYRLHSWAEMFPLKGPWHIFPFICYDRLAYSYKYVEIYLFRRDRGAKLCLNARAPFKLYFYLDPNLYNFKCTLAWQ